MAPIIKDALEAALHALITIEGTTGTDLSAYSDAQSDGCDANGAWDCLRGASWTITNAPTIDLVRRALGAAMSEERSA
jgi:hypothetical protein